METTRPLQYRQLHRLTAALVGDLILYGFGWRVVPVCTSLICSIYTSRDERMYVQTGHWHWMWGKYDLCGFSIKLLGLDLYIQLGEGWIVIALVILLYWRHGDKESLWVRCLHEFVINRTVMTNTVCRINIVYLTDREGILYYHRVVWEHFPSIKKVHY